VKVNLFTFVDLYRKGLATLAGLLEKAAEHARLGGIAEADLLEWRLAPDMYPLARQAQIVINIACTWPARAAGLEIPASLDGENDLQALRAGIKEATAFLDGLTAAQFEGRDDVTFTLELGSISPTLAMGQWVAGFATTNFYFHLATAYGILRSRGVPLGKLDLFAGGL
jgi:hypothetical protein